MARKPGGGEDASFAYLAPRDLSAHELPSQAALGFHRGSTGAFLGWAAATIERLSGELAALQRAREEDALAHERWEVSLEEERKRAELLVGEALVDAHDAGQVLKAEAEVEAEKIRAEAKTQIGAAREEAKLLVSEARLEAKKQVADARAECERLGVQAEQYKLLTEDVQRRSIEVLKRGLEALGEQADSGGPGDEVVPFRTPDPRGRRGRSRRPRRSERAGTAIPADPGRPVRADAGRGSAQVDAAERSAEEDLGERRRP